MAYYVDTCSGQISEHETLQDALDIATHALTAGLDCGARLGWHPFWMTAVEIRRGKQGLSYHLGGEETNQQIVAQTKCIRTSADLIALIGA